MLIAGLLFFALGLMLLISVGALGYALCAAGTALLLIVLLRPLIT
jgi:hypothetical protein